MSAPATTAQRVVRGVLVDLDDTLHPQAAFLDAAWRAVAAAGADCGLEPDALLAALRWEAAAGSDRGGIVDRALGRVGGEGGLVPELVAAFRAVRPSRLTPYPGVPGALAVLRARVPVALVSDGDVAGQERKIAALGLADAFDAVVLSDRRGRAYRKPHRRPFEEALRALGVTAADAVMIGDRPEKDVAGAAALGLRAVRVGTGEYAEHPDHPATWFRCDGFAAAVARLLPHLPRPGVSGGIPTGRVAHPLRRPGRCVAATEA